MAVELTLLQLALANFFLMVGACLQGVIGWGIGTLGAPLLFLISPTLLPAPMLLNSAVLTLLLLLRERRSLSLGPLRHAVGGNIVGTVLAGVTLVFIHATAFEALFGLLILVAVGLSIAGFKPQLKRSTSVLAGGASGYMGTITAVGGPPIALIYQNEKGPLVRANLAGFFAFGSFTALVTLYFSGLLGVYQLKLFLLTVPGVIMGFLLSRFFVRRLPVHILRPLILSIAGLAGVSALIRGLL
ncbi:sulfite exporter TauE/SafE family protein [Hydrocarboniclastica marina]|uniref:Probable membrane transporter protein n=1 Tax=Hydrocarboniclastica marina TaxID=2259620 RepID=A0A4P7XFW0_9ALTE|nr:sulfite exporter TauE/SafE family protein [Hydrocarboniclastica marina]MAL99697.1 hypothetical protein [Alteromonadaceae bacterium]QCF25324.1 sulfite exporter TauE/SafE family protein [Hydrocarboniclastica marina]|tara:strand:- start:3010 stop:3738 length:729 start_codon:yes stop_codon:yes gene_type:complete